jgi:arabinogalactan oligomer/maltooligosaccharide transport system substrate-binding protein
MLRRSVWFSLSVICLSTILGLTLVLLVQARSIQAKSFPSAVNGLYTAKLPLMVNNYVPPRIIIWHQFDESYLAEYNAIVKEFNLAHPDMTIGLIKVDNLWGGLSTTIPAGVGPDIVAYANDPIGEWASAGYLAPLDPYISLGYMNANFEPVAVKAVTWDDQIWGIPEFQEGIALVYNRDLITDTEIPEPNDFAGLLTKAVDFQLDNPGKYYLCNQGLGGYDAYHAAPIYFGYGLKDYGGLI